MLDLRENVVIAWYGRGIKRLAKKGATNVVTISEPWRQLDLSSTISLTLVHDRIPFSGDLTTSQLI